MSSHPTDRQHPKAIFPGEVFADTNDFDGGIRQLLPNYDEMLDAVASCLPSHAQRILDLGCGTGGLSIKVFQRCPTAKIMALDYSPRMIEFAKSKLEAAGYAPQWTAMQADFGDWANHQLAVADGFDACVSSLAIHHLNDEMKLKLFSRIHECLHPGGVFWNADPVLPEFPALADIYQQIGEHWAVQQGATLAAVRAKIGKSTAYGYSNPDQLATLDAHLQMLQTAGFTSVAVPWKYYGWAVFGGIK